MPAEQQMLTLIDRFGAQAVLGRPLGVREMRHMLRVENIVKAIRSRNAADDSIVWEAKHPEWALLLEELEHD